MITSDPVQIILSHINSYRQDISETMGLYTSNITNLEIIQKAKGFLPFCTPDDPEELLSEETDSWIVRVKNLLVNYKFSLMLIGALLSCFALKPLASSYISMLSNKKPNKRRAPKLPNGARRDLILIVGSPTEPLTRLIALDFERRGFVIYLTIFDEKDLRYIESNTITEGINYLNLNNAEYIGANVAKFGMLFENQVSPFPGATPHYLKLAAVIFTPNLHFPMGPIESLAQNSWKKYINRFNDMLNLLSSGIISLIRSQNSKIIMICPNIVSTLNLPFHGIQNWYENSLRSIFSTLTKELYNQGLFVTQVKLGNLNISTNGIKQRSRVSNLINTEVRNWESEMITIYGDSFSKSEFRSNPTNGATRRTKLKKLHHLLFDLVTSKKNPSICYCGTGSRIYDIVSFIIPDTILNWILV